MITAEPVAEGLSTAFAEQHRSRSLTDSEHTIRGEHRGDDRQVKVLVLTGLDQVFLLIAVCKPVLQVRVPKLVYSTGLA